MRRVTGAILILATTSFADDTWTFAFENGDHVRGGFFGVRDGTVLFGMLASPRPLGVPLAEIRAAEPAPPEPGMPEPPRATQVLRLRDGGALLGHCRGIFRGKVEFDVRSFGTVTVPGRDVTELLGTEDAARAYYRAMSERRSLDAEPLTLERFEALWIRLGLNESNVAWQARRELVGCADDAVVRLAARLQTQPDAPDAVAMWIRRLDASSAEEREAAHARLLSLGETAESQLRAASRRVNSAEARQRLNAILAAIDPEHPRELDPEVRRFVRAISILEEVGSPEAQVVLERMARGAPGAPTGVAAEEALARLRRIR